jgi:ABC-type cobalamin/Fe3+-siderophores transport system ATPase subunit
MKPAIAKYFNVAGPCIPGQHYMLPAIDRLPEARQLAERGQYFIIHAARQSGKTTLLRALAREINAEGRHYALYCSLETMQGFEDADRGMKRILALLRTALELNHVPELNRIQFEIGNDDAVRTRRKVTFTP